MKLKSLLLGSAAVLALSTGAQAADPIVEFVSLGVCDALGMSGLTIESDDTCLLVSGSVEYTFETGNYTGEFFTDSTVEWQVLFDAATQTDAGTARAVIRLNDSGTQDNGDLLVEAERAYVQFGDTTVLTAGRIGSIFDTEILDKRYGWLNFDEVDNGYLLGNEVETGGHGIQIEALVADGFTVLAALENLQNDGEGTAGLGVAYNGAGISAEAGVLLGDIFGEVDQVNYYARAVAEFDAFLVRGGILVDGTDDANETRDWIASLGAEATFDMFSLSADAMFADEAFNIAAEGAFGATDAIEIYIGAAYSESNNGLPLIMTAAYYDDAAIVTDELFTVYGGVNFDVTETIVATAELGYVDYNGGDLVYGAAGVTYAPGGNFETSVDVYGDTEDLYAITFNASKSF
ncbi:hypothetical protein [Pelagibacterium mangrovi]|uniref:hypothetical protein n=1 Tax=Pelagibacterium mangrovi TaxID=3119828 RepID=UPI002FC846F3